MAKITNEGRSPRAVHVGGKYVDLAPGQTIEISEKDATALNEHPVIKGDATLKVEGGEAADTKGKGKPKADGKGEAKAPDGGAA